MRPGRVQVGLALGQLLCFACTCRIVCFHEVGQRNSGRFWDWPDNLKLTKADCKAGLMYMNSDEHMQDGLKSGLLN